MRVSEVLASKGSDAIFTIRPDASIRELLDVLADHNVGAMIVSEDGESMVGIVSERDVVRKLRDVENARDVTVASIMTSDVQVAGPDDSFGSLPVSYTHLTLPTIYSV